MRLYQAVSAAQFGAGVLHGRPDQLLPQLREERSRSRLPQGILFLSLSPPVLRIGEPFISVTFVSRMSA